MLRIHNTLSGQIEEFTPLVEGEAKFYYCGPTVWDYGHIGNFRSAIAADILRRYLKFKGFQVTSRDEHHGCRRPHHRASRRKPD